MIIEAIDPISTSLITSLNFNLLHLIMVLIQWNLVVGIRM